MTPTTTATPLDLGLFEDLIGTPYVPQGREPGTALDCFGLAIEIDRRRGFMVPDPFEYEGELDGRRVEDLMTNAYRGWTQIGKGDAGPGDHVACEIHRRPHVMTIIDRPGPGGRVVQALGPSPFGAGAPGVVTSRWPEMATVKAYFRARPDLHLPEMHHVGPPTRAQEGPDSAIDVCVVPDVTTLEGRSRRSTAWVGDSLAAMIPHGWEQDPETFRIMLNGSRVEPAEWVDVCPEPGDEILIIRAPSFGAAIATGLGLTSGGFSLFGFTVVPATLTAFGTVVATGINIAVAVGLSFAASLLLGPAQAARKESDESSPTYNLSGARNSIRNGQVIPVVYGTHTIGGQILQVFYNVNGDGKSVLHMLLGLSQGEIDSIGGIATDEDDLRNNAIPDSITINGNPASSYKGVEVSTRMGSTGQQSIPGFQEVATPASIDITLDDVPVGSEWATEDTFRYISDGSIDGFDLNFFFPEGLINYSPNGNPGARTVTYAVRYKLLGSTTWITAPIQGVQRLTRAAFSSNFRVRGITLGKYEIEIERRSGISFLGQSSAAWPETAADHASTFNLQTINEIVSEDLSYPNVALLAIKAVATEQLSGQVPNVLASIKGKKIWTWDGVSATSPNFTFGWSSSPAWQAHDVMTNDRYGVGQQMRNRDMDLQSFADCETFHQIAVPDGRGSTHARGVSNIVFDTQTTAWDAAQSVLNPFRASLIQVGTTIKCRHETTVSTISQLFTPGNIVSGSYESGYRNPDVAANVIEVQFPNEETNFEVEPTEREEVAAGDPIVKSTSGIKAATHPARAATWAQFLLNIERALLRTIKFSSPLDAMVTEPGDVFAFEHDVDGDTNVVGGRVTADAAASTITLDRDLVIAGTSKISVRTTGTGQLVVQERTIDEVNGTYVAGTALDLTAAWTVGDVPTEGDVFAAGPSATYRKLYRCTKIRFDQNLKVEVQGLEYDSSVYDDDPGVVEAATDALESLHLNPSAVTNLAASPLRRIGKDGSIANITRIEWSHDRDAECDVYVRRLEGPE